MRLVWKYAFVALGSLALSACDTGGTTSGNEPVGQVVATVNGQEITLLELRAELGTASPSDPEAAKAAEQNALRNIIGRKVLANAAREQGLDNTPEFALQRLRATDALLVQALQAKIAREMPAPAQEEAVRYVADHRDIFAERKVFLVDQVTMPRPADPQALREFEPLKVMAEVEAMLVRNKVRYRRATNVVIDAVGTEPNLIERIVKLPPREVFIMPGGDGILFSQIRETRVVPFTGDPAITYALGILRRQRVQETTQREFNAIAAKSAGLIVYNKDYQPAAPVPDVPVGDGVPSSTPAPAGTQTPPPEPGSDTGSRSGGKAG